MAEKLVARGKSTAALPPRRKSIEIDGATIRPGDALSFTGEEGTFRFHYANASGTEVTVWGPSTGGWNNAQWRTFYVTRVRSATTVAAVAAKAQTANDVDYASMTPGQKAAFTKRMKALAASGQVAA